MGRDENRSVHEFYRLKALITFEQMNTSVVHCFSQSIYTIYQLHIAARHNGFISAQCLFVCFFHFQFLFVIRQLPY